MTLFALVVAVCGLDAKGHSEKAGFATAVIPNHLRGTLSVGEGEAISTDTASQEMSAS